MPNPKAQAPTLVAVNPTETTLQTFDTNKTQTLALQLYNADASQTLDARLRVVSRTDANQASFPPAMVDDLGLASIPPLTSRYYEFRCGGAKTVAVVATASGAGLSAYLAANNLEAPP